MVEREKKKRAEEILHDYTPIRWEFDRRREERLSLASTALLFSFSIYFRWENLTDKQDYRSLNRTRIYFWENGPDKGGLEILYDCADGIDRDGDLDKKSAKELNQLEVAIGDGMEFTIHGKRVDECS